MSKTLISPVKRWPGTVEISQPLSYPQLIAWQDGLAESQLQLAGEKRRAASSEFALLPAICIIVEKWNLQGLPEALTPATFPATPRGPVSQLISWLIDEISLATTEEVEPLPKES